MVTNSVPHDLQKMQCQKIKTMDISILSYLQLVVNMPELVNLIS